jgi:hypothetical protein
MQAREQYVRDISMVLSNEYEIHKEIEDMKERGLEFVEVSNYIADIYYNAINDALDKLDEAGRCGLGISLIREMCIGLGTDTFDDLARYYLED